MERGITLKYQKILLLCLIILASYWTSGCQNKGDKDESADFNQYIYTHGNYAYTDNEYIFFENGQLFFVDSLLSSALSKICTRPECQHTDDSCSSYVDSRAIFSSANYLYYITRDEKGKYGAYEMDLEGQARRCIKKLPMLDSGNIGFSYKFYNNYLVLEVTKWKADSAYYMVYLTDFTDKNSKIEIIFGAEDNSDIVYGGTELRDGWVFATEVYANSKNKTLVGYKIEEKEYHKLVDNWTFSNTISLKGDMLYWFEAGVGFFSLSLSTMEERKYSDCDATYEYGPGLYDDKYLYLTNTIPQLDKLGIIDETKKGIYIYDYEGHLKQYISTVGTPIYPVYCLSSPEYVFFYDAAGNKLPKYYIEKKSICNGNASLLTLE